MILNVYKQIEAPQPATGWACDAPLNLKQDAAVAKEGSGSVCTDLGDRKVY